MSLYRKYRPQNFANLVGQDHVRITLMNALKTGHVSHAYLFTGPRGTGKTSTARLLAKAINCEKLKEAEPCEVCDICRDITDGRLIDLIEIDAASNRGIDEIRDLREKIQFSPTRARSKVYIIDEVHMLTKEAFNALLKTLEEPPTHVYFILATTEVHKIPETILSRCQRFDFKRIDDVTLAERLNFITKEEKITAEPVAIEAIAHCAQGGLRDAIGLLEQLTENGHLTLERVQDILGISGRTSLQKMYDLLVAGKVEESLQIIDQLYKEGHDLAQFNKDFLEFLRQRMIASIYAGEPALTAKVLQWINFFQSAYEQSKYTTIVQLPLEVAVIQACLPETTAAKPDTEKNSSSVGNSAAHPLREATKKHGGELKPAMVEKPLPPVEPSLAVESSPGPAVLSAERNHQAITKNAPTAPAASSAEITLEQIIALWPKVLQHLKNPTARHTLTTGKPFQIEGNAVRVGFKTQFHLEKVKETGNRNDIETAMKEIFHTTLKFVPALDQTVLTPDMSDEKTSQLLEILGGELMEE